MTTRLVGTVHRPTVTATSNHAKVTRGVTETLEIDLVDDAGNPLPLERLEGASATFQLRANPSNPPDLITITTDDSTRLSFVPGSPALLLTLLDQDTVEVPLGLYFYQVTLLLQDQPLAVIIEWALIELGLGGTADPALPPFNNVVKIDHDYQLPGDLRYVTSGGSPIESAQVRVYYKVDYDQGHLDAPIGVTTTNAGGAWASPILVTPGFSYVVRFDKPGEYGPDTREIFA